MPLFIPRAQRTLRRVTEITFASVTDYIDVKQPAHMPVSKA